MVRDEAPVSVERRIAANISPQSAFQRSDREIARWSHAQHGVITLAQLERLGLSRRAVRNRVAAGRLRRLHRGVFAVERPTREARWISAVLAVGRGAVLSHRSAAALWGLCDDHRGAIDVTVRRSGGGARPGIVVHRTETLPEADHAIRSQIPCTSLPRTLLDLAAVVDARRLARAVDRAEDLRAFDLRDVGELLARSPRRRGVRALATVLADHQGPAVTGSAAEERLLAIVGEAALPTPEVNAWIPLPEGGGFRPDLLWRDRRLIVEVDGRAHHSRRRAFEHDRQRDRRLALAGYETHRYTASEVFGEPRRVALELRAFLDAGRR